METDPRRETGRVGEQLAAAHLERCGFRILDRNFRTRWGELDVVACDDRMIVFCEVKARVALGRGSPDPLESIRPAKRSQVRRMASRWLVERRDRPHVDQLRFDAIGVTLDAAGRLLRLDHLEDAF
jgi:putative endonuclease